MIHYHPVEDPEFVAVLRGKIQQYFKRNQISIYADSRAYAKAISLVLAYGLAYSMLIQTSHFPLYLILCALLGMLKIFVALNIAHDAAHHAFFRNRKLNELLLFLFDILGANGYMWKLRHVHSHHAYTNIPGHDADIKQSALVRIFPTSPLRNLHRYQHLYMPVLYGFYSLHWLFFRDIKDFISTPPNNRVQNGHDIMEILRLITGKIVYFMTMIMIPYLLLDLELYQIVVGFIIMQIVASYTVALALASAHVSLDSEFPEPDNTGHLPYSFVMHQLITTTDFATQNQLVTQLYGGFNHHVIHHLFPQVCHIHYPALTKILKAVCQEYEMPYMENETLHEAIWAHYMLLKNRSKEKTLATMPEF